MAEQRESSVVDDVGVQQASCGGDVCVPHVVVPLHTQQLALAVHVEGLQLASSRAISIESPYPTSY